jgi:hypothetical protein
MADRATVRRSSSVSPRRAILATSRKEELLARQNQYQVVPACHSPIDATRFHTIRNEGVVMIYKIYNTNGLGGHVRAAAHKKAHLLRIITEGDEVDVVCQVAGEEVKDGTYTSIVWDRLRDGGYVSDLYVNTPSIGTFTPGIPRCP